MNQSQNLLENTTSKEISPGVILYKQVIPPLRPDQDMVYIFRVQSNRLNVLEFTADFSGSDNIIMDGDQSGRLMSITTIPPFEQLQVARLQMKRDWKLKTKFKFILKPAMKEVQQRFVQADQQKLLQELSHNQQVLRTYSFSLKAPQELSKLLADKGIKFVDIEFPPNDDSVFGYEMDHSVLETIVQWRRPTDFFTQKDANKRPEVFYDKIEPADIKQGALGDCWLMSVLSALAERPNLIKRLFITQQISAQGVYRLKICKNGEWVYVTVDDLFPCYPLSTPIFSQSHGNELWVLLIEKAFAKLNGCYFSLRNGFPHEAFIDLTGCPTETTYFQELKLIKNAFQVLWQKLLKYDEEGYLLTTFTEGVDQWTEGVRPQDDNDKIGLVAGHAYAIIQVKEVRNHQLLKIRNPWGNFEWKGDWGDTSPLWTPDMIRDVQPTFDVDDGTFWMSYKDFLTYFSGLTVCKVRNWDEARIKGKFVKVTDVDDPNIEVIMSKWYYSLEITQKCKIIVGLHQEDERGKAVGELRSYLDIGLSIFRKIEQGPLELVMMTNTKFDRQVELEVELTPGSYIILPRTTGLTLRRPSNANSLNYSMILPNGNLHPSVESTICDIFRKFDMLLTRELGFIEFKGFFECLDKTLEANQFKSQILQLYASSDKGLSLKGFLDYFKDTILQLGEEPVQKWFQTLGYDQDLYSIRSRIFLITVHSSTELAVTVRDALQTDLYNRAWIFGAQTQNEFTQIESLHIEHQGVRALSCYNRLADTFTLIAVNDHTYPIEFTINVGDSTGALFSTKNGSIRKRLEAGQMEFMMHLKPDPNQKQKFKFEYQCGWVPV